MTMTYIDENTTKEDLISAIMENDDLFDDIDSRYPSPDLTNLAIQEASREELYDIIQKWIEEGDEISGIWETSDW